MVRTAPLIVVCLCLAVLLVAKPRVILQLFARLWCLVLLRGNKRARVPEWAAHYLWAVPGDPVPRYITTLEDSARMVAAIILAVPVGLVFITLLTGE